MMTLRYYGSLRKVAAQTQDYDIGRPISVEDLIKELKIPPSAVKLVMVNHAPVRRQFMIQPDDAVALFPQEYAFFADWKDYRLNS